MSVNPQIVSRLLASLSELGIEPVKADATGPEAPVNLVPAKTAFFEPAPRKLGAGVIPWSPPLANWNPWTSCNIDEGPLANVSRSVGENARMLTVDVIELQLTPGQISNDLMNEYNYNLENNPQIKKVCGFSLNCALARY